MFNADLALSVTMTGISTLLSVFMLPINLLIYTSGTYSNDVVKALDWFSLFLSLIVVIGGISAGVITSAWYNSTRFNLLANKLGNLAGIALVTFSAVVSSTGSESSLWSQDAVFYIGVAAPCLFGLLIATYLSTRFQLDKPERVSVSVESCYQNTGIATSVAASMFTGDELATAIGVPLYYGLVEAALLACYCLVCWKIGWTKAPANENFCTIIATSYEVEQTRMESPNAIEVVHNSNPKDDQDIEDLVFNQTVEGYQVDEHSLHEKSNISLQTNPEGMPVSSTDTSVAGSRTGNSENVARPIIGNDDDDALPANQGEFI
jgi:hypothetical protein